MYKLIMTLITMGIMISGEHTVVLGAEQAHPPNPKLESAQGVQPSSSKAVFQRARPPHRAPVHPSTAEQQEQKEQRCVRDVVAAVTCEPAPGSPLSASPLVSHPNPPLEKPWP